MLLMVSVISIAKHGGWKYVKYMKATVAFRIRKLSSLVNLGSVGVLLHSINNFKTRVISITVHSCSWTLEEARARRAHMLGVRMKRLTCFVLIFAPCTSYKHG